METTAPQQQIISTARLDPAIQESQPSVLQRPCKKRRREEIESLDNPAQFQRVRLRCWGSAQDLDPRETKDIPQCSGDSHVSSHIISQKIIPNPPVSPSGLFPEARINSHLTSPNPHKAAPSTYLPASSREYLNVLDPRGNPYLMPTFGNKLSASVVANDALSYLLEKSITARDSTLLPIDLTTTYREASLPTAASPQGLREPSTDTGVRSEDITRDDYTSGDAQRLGKPSRRGAIVVPHPKLPPCNMMKPPPLPSFNGYSPAAVPQILSPYQQPWESSCTQPIFDDKGNPELRDYRMPPMSAQQDKDGFVMERHHPNMEETRLQRAFDKQSPGSRDHRRQSSLLEANPVTNRSSQGGLYTTVSLFTSVNPSPHGDPIGSTSLFDDTFWGNHQHYLNYPN